MSSTMSFDDFFMSPMALSDSDVWVKAFDVSTVATNSMSPVTDGFTVLLCDDTDIGKDVCVTDVLEGL